MELSQLIMLITIIVTWILGIVSKKSKFINNNIIPIQNLIIGLLVAIVEWIITEDFNTAIALSGLVAGGSYDILHNIQKIINKGDEK